ncbi:ribosome small subunit-dependent GTPase A [Neisseria sp. Ec49-e6-T10]|uniref:ribosome small subunit-dependent GTPase A n=1 Tax=Neisseria sp. Ec49-e6-T10 TaxID=3140744 RepID=UPI003EBAEAF4
MNQLIGQIVTSFGRLFIVEDCHGKTFEATTRKKRVDFACGDQVEFTPINERQVVIERSLPRKSLLYRQDHFKTKVFAANVTQLVIVLAPVPSPNEELLQRALVAAEEAQITPLIVLNKSDLPEVIQWQEKLSFYQTLGYPFITLSALSDITPLKISLEGQCSILLGQSGMGKSTLTNALLGEEKARIGTISTALDSGKHTTTHTQLFHLNQQTQLIDSPGLQEFGLKHIIPADLIHYFPDFRAFIGQCRFHNCTHRQEPNCAIKQAAENGLIEPQRLVFFQRLMDELLR